MKLNEILKNVEIAELHADPELEIGGVAYDSRAVTAGGLFVAVRGHETDGHAYIAAAVESGAACVLCEEPPSVTVPYVLCANTRRAMAYVSANWFGNPAEKLKIIGVTGTKGKTTTTSLIKNALESLTGKPVGLIGTICDMIGPRVIESKRTTPTTPDSYELHGLFAQMLEAGCEYAVMEVSSHALVLDRVAGIEFEVGVFTNLAHEHLDFHETMDEYARAKSILFAHSRKCVFNCDNSYSRVMQAAAEGDIFTYSIDNVECDVVAKRVRLSRDRVEFSALTLETLQPIEIAAPGKFSVYNALAAIAVCLKLGFGIGDIADALADAPAVKGRAEVVPIDADFTVIIDYAHTPDSLEQIITTLKDGAQGRVVTLFGCGGDRDEGKRPIMGDIAARLSDFVIVTSDNPRTEKPEAIIEKITAGISGDNYVVIPDRRAAIEYAIENAQTGDTILLAGKGHETYQERGKVKFPFDERVVVAEIMAVRAPREDTRV
ncbi:MAG: UDP-N-acetylmuramoyl-L-alanyl-D-glutamate--2,6-diaminopimelate ligase [Oscillospiraceae bacterium]|nr:UDP-N-acetylmuramoyl-L-alanyl-D-glutamate--2,6-diaminopimelate ligase [Oscillospiraceae bacterium]